MRSSLLTTVAAATVMSLSLGLTASAVTVSVDPGAAWVGYMNWNPIPTLPGTGSGASNWGTADLNAVFAGPVLKLSPNTIGDPNPYWYTPSGGPGATGNKMMDANMYVQPADGTYTGTTLTFTGEVLSNTLVGQVDANGNGWTSVAFIKDFAPDYSSFVQTTVPLTPGVFSISLATVNDPARHVQYGFETVGPNVWATDAAQYGDIQIQAVVPEPASLGLLAVGAGLIIRRRRA